jgi:integrase
MTGCGVGTLYDSVDPLAGSGYLVGKLLLCLDDGCFNLVVALDLDNHPRAIFFLAHEVGVVAAHGMRLRVDVLDKEVGLTVGQHAGEIHLPDRNSCGSYKAGLRTGVNLTEIKKGFKTACKLASIPYGQSMPGGITFHDLRHTFATRLAERGVDESTRMALLGQSSLKMVRRYSHATPEAMAEAVGRLAHQVGDVLDFKRKQG